MDKTGFKIGDKVKLSSPPKYGQIDKHLYIEGIIGVVTKVDNFIWVEWNTNLCVVCGTACRKEVHDWSHNPQDIKHAMKKGQQLLFSFMNE